MAGSKGRGTDRISADPTPLTSNPFAALLGLQAEDAGDPSTEPPLQNEEANGSLDSTAALGSRVVVRRQKKGQGGKTATFVEGIATSRLSEVAQRLKRELGCSARCDGLVVVVGTSDHARVARWLTAAGVQTVVVGN